MPPPPSRLRTFLRRSFGVRSRTAGRLSVWLLGDCKELLSERSDWITSQDLIYSNTGMTQTLLYSEFRIQGESTAEVWALISAFCFPLQPASYLTPTRLNGKVHTAGVWLVWGFFPPPKSIALILPPPPKNKLTHKSDLLWSNLL